MAKQRYINTKFWSDGFIREKLNPLDRYLFLYFLTNEKTNICGTYELPMSTMSSETGIEVEMLKKMLPRFKTRIHYIDGWVYIRNFKKHQSTTSLTVQKGIEVEESKIPSNIKAKIEEIEKKIQGMDRVSGGIIYLNSNLNLNSNYNLNNIATDVAPVSRVKRNTEDLIVLGEEIKKLEDSDQRHLNIIALYLENRKPDLRTWGQFQEAIGRHAKAASALKKFQNDQILIGFTKAKKQTSEWTLETVWKQLTK